MKEVPNLFEQKSQCCGCFACISMCTHNAIDMVQDEEGFFYPSIDEKKCVRCRKCILVCPIKNK